MYEVTQNFINQSHSPVQTYSLRGYIGSIEITADNILKGSMTVTMQSTKKDFGIGYAYVGELKATFIGVNIPKYQWLGKVISLELGLKVGQTYEYIPLQDFTVTEANITSSGVVVKAYDNMTKFDIPFPYTQLHGTVGEILTLVCTECGVSLEEVESPVVNVTLSQDNDCETYRDVIYWLAQCLGGFATINRDNKLEIRKYSSTSVDTLTDSNRVNGATYGEYVTNYNGIYIQVGDTVEYYGSTEAGSTLKLGANPFLQDNANARQVIAQGIVSALANVTYVPFKARIATGFHYDLGDVLTLSGGLGDGTKKFCIMSISYTYNGLVTIQGFGDDPTSKIKSDRNITGLINNVKTNELAFYEVTNVSRINISPNQQRRILRLKMASKVATRIQIHIEINLETEDTDNNDITIVTAEYTASGLIQVLHPQETYIDGKHVLHLMYIMAVDANWTDYFMLDLKAESGIIKIEPGSVKAFASGLGLVGDGSWDGTFDIEEAFGTFPLHELTYTERPTESVTVSKLAPTPATASDIVSTFKIKGLTVEAFEEEMHFNEYLSEMTWGEVSELTWGAVADNYNWGN